MDGRRKKDDGAAGSVDISTLERFAGVKTLAKKASLKMESEPAALGNGWSKISGSLSPSAAFRGATGSRPLGSAAAEPDSSWF